MSESGVFETPFALSAVGTPFLIGLAVGYCMKKLMRLALLLVGAVLIVLFVAEQYQLIVISDTAVQTATATLSQATNSFNHWLFQRLSLFSTQGVSVTAGLVLGFKMG
jgi:uncharacterized membrane protein (Fun14 family)